MDLDSNSPLEQISSDKEYLKFKNHKWVLYGESEQKSRYNKTDSKRIAYLINPVNCYPIMATSKYLLPEKLRGIDAFDDRISETIAFKLRLSLASSPKTPTLKEKLFKLQAGKCSMCDKMIEFDYLHYNTTHIHHIEPIKKGGNKFAIQNLTLTHS